MNIAYNKLKKLNLLLYVDQTVEICQTNYHQPLNIFHLLGLHQQSKHPINYNFSINIL